jgi:hypothetical protein
MASALVQDLDELWLFLKNKAAEGDIPEEDMNDIEKAIDLISNIIEETGY